MKKESFGVTGAWQATPRPGADVLFLQQQKRKRWGMLLLGGVALLVFLLGAVVKVRSLLYSEDQVSLSVQGPRQVASAESSEFTVVYSNRNWAAIENALLVISYPESFQPEASSGITVNGSQIEIPLGTIRARMDGKAIFAGKFYGSQGDTVYLKMQLRYSPSSISSQFEKEIQYGVSLVSSILSLDMLAPQQAANGDVVEYAIDYANQSDRRLPNIRVKVEYPDRFTFVSSDPVPSEGDSVWYIGTLDSAERGKIIVRGRISGIRDEVKKAKGMIGYFGGGGKFVAYGSSEQMTRIITPPLSIVQTINGKQDLSVNAGDTLEFVLNYRNNGDIGLRDVIITMKLDSDILDYTRLKQSSGSYDVASHTLIWKASDVSGLARLSAGDSGTIVFSVPVLNPIPVSVLGKNFAIQTTAKIDSPDVPTPIGANKVIASNVLLTKVNSAVGIDLVLTNNDSIFTNRGPFSPVVGQESVYTLRFDLSNEYNDITNAKLAIELPSGSRYQKHFAPETEVVDWNERTNTLTWDLATYRAARGKHRELRFQIAVIPDASLINRVLQLVNNAIFTGTDRFTGQDIRIEYDTTHIRDDIGREVVLRVSEES